MSYDFPDQQKNEKTKDIARYFRVDEEKNLKIKKELLDICISYSK